MTYARRLGVPLVTAAWLLACGNPPTAARQEPAPAPAKAAASEGKGQRSIAAPATGDVATIVREEAARSSETLVVAVGAPWCEPCVAFHDALAAGDLDAELAGVRFLEFDIDRDKARLEEAGYRSRFVPLFALPGPDGRASGRQIDGGIKGPRAVAHIMARLKPLLAAP